MSKHNKKRNTGIIYELMLMHMSNCIVEHDKKSLKIATDILENAFNKNSQIYREFKVFNTLTNVKIDNPTLGANLLKEIKDDYNKINRKALDREKSLLIKEINYKIKDKNFYYRRVKNYVDCANIQKMLNEWQKKDLNFKKIIELESKVIHSLNQPKISNDLIEAKKSMNKNSNKLILKLMTEKINKKYTHFSEDQKEIIRNYAFYKGDLNREAQLVEFLSRKKKKCINLLNEFKLKNDNKILSQKINVVINNVKSINENTIDDQEIVKFLTIVKLINEIKGV